MNAVAVMAPSRRILHARAITTDAQVNRSSARRSNSDAALIDACREFNKLEQRKIRMIKANENEDELVFELALGQICIEQDQHLRRMCDVRATAILGHRARALAFASWDAGDLAYRAKAGDATEDLILLAMIRDLTCGSDRS